MKITKIFELTLYFIEAGRVQEVVLTKQRGLFRDELCHIPNLIQKIGSGEWMASVKSGTGAMLLYPESAVVDGMIITVGPNPDYEYTKDKRI